MKRLTAILLTLFFAFLTSSCSGGGGLTWSEKKESQTWGEATLYCAKLSEDGSSDWRLPTISELRTLIRNCPATMTGGNCEVDDDCLVSSCHGDSCNGCGKDESGKYSFFGDASERLWSSSPVGDNGDNSDSKRAWYVNFMFGSVNDEDMNLKFDVRCVRGHFNASASGSGGGSGSTGGGSGSTGGGSGSTGGDSGSGGGNTGGDGGSVGGDTGGASGDSGGDVGGNTGGDYVGDSGDTAADTGDSGSTGGDTGSGGDSGSSGDTGSNNCDEANIGKTCATDTECGRCMICATGGKCVKGCVSNDDCAMLQGLKCNTKLARCVSVYASQKACDEANCPTGCCYAERGLSGLKCAKTANPATCGLCAQGEIYSPDDKKCVPAVCSSTTDNCPSLNSESPSPAHCYECKAGELICRLNKNASGCSGGTIINAAKCVPAGQECVPDVSECCSGMPCVAGYCY